MEKLRFHQADKVIFRLSSDGGHSRRGGLAVVKDASHSPLLATGVLPNALWLAPAQPVSHILDNGDPLAKLAAKR